MTEPKFLEARAFIRVCSSCLSPNSNPEEIDPPGDVTQVLQLIERHANQNMGFTEGAIEIHPQEVDGRGGHPYKIVDGAIINAYTNEVMWSGDVSPSADFLTALSDILDREGGAR